MPIGDIVNKDNENIRGARQITNSRNFMVIHNFEVLVCVAHKVDILRREHLQQGGEVTGIEAA